MLVPRYSSRMIDYPTRLRNAQARMIELGVDLMFLPYSASLHYLMGVAREEQNFGNTIYPGDWMTGAWIAADCEPILTLPRMQAAFHGTHTQHAVRVLPDAGDPLAGSATHQVINGLNKRFPYNHCVMSTVLMASIAIPSRP